MYLPRQFEETRREILHGLIKSHPLATVVIQADEGLVVNHIPLLLANEDGATPVLRGHIARANPLWRELVEAAEAVVIFQGPQAYITPSWYPGKRVDGKAVPTWNYAVVHVHGVPRFIEDRHWLLAHISEMTNAQEAGEALPWKVSDAPADYVARMLEAIVGIEIPVTRIVGKWKVSQNRPKIDRLGVIEGLKLRGGDNAQAMAALVNHFGAMPENL